MSVATEFVPDYYIPERARTSGRAGASCAPERLATVTTLHRPSERTLTPAVRLTRRGVVVLAAAVCALAAAVIALAWASAPGPAGAPTRVASATTVTVGPGDSLWSIAGRVAPQRDPRAEVAELQRLNHLGAAALVPGQVLRTR